MTLHNFTVVTCFVGKQEPQLAPIMVNIGLEMIKLICEKRPWFNVYKDFVFIFTSSSRVAQLDKSLLVTLGIWWPYRPDGPMF